LLQREGALGPIRIRDTEFALGIANASKQAIYRARFGSV
jgi:hypothetical protein